MKNVWVVVASSSKCRVFTQQKHQGPLLQVDQLENSEGAMSAGELTSDRPGRAFDSAGQGRHAMSQSVDPVEQETIRFAKKVATTIETGRKKEAFDRLVLVSDPSFLGHLRPALSSATHQRLSAEINKNLADADPEAVRAALPFRI